MGVTSFLLTASTAALLVGGPVYAQEQRFEGRRSVEDFWQGKGAPPHVAAAIADNVDRESGFDPIRLGDGGTSLGLYQHHNERMRALLASAENEQAFRDVMGADPIAAAHWDEIRRAQSRPEARRLWARYFERCKVCGNREPAAAPIAAPAHALAHETHFDPFVKPEPAGRALVFSVAKKERK